MFLYLIQIFNIKILNQYEDIYLYYFIFISTPTWRDGLSRFSRGIWRFTLIACGPEWLSSTGVCNSYCISRAVAYAWCPSALRIRHVELAFAQTLRPLSLAGPSMAFEIYLNCTFRTTISPRTHWTRRTMFDLIGSIESGIELSVWARLAGQFEIPMWT